jgi:TetR/AcrR family transcriptional regulator, repressor of fatR-cypB operon
MEGKMPKEQIDKREAILQASLEIFAQKGFHGAPTSHISKMANVGTGTIYRYFENKDALIEALYVDIDGKLRSLIYEMVDDDAPVREDMLRILTSLFQFFLENSNEFRFLEQYFNSPYGVAKRRTKDACDKPMWQLMNKGIKQQIIKDLPLEILFGLFFGPIMILVRDQLTGTYTFSKEMIQRTIEACWDSIRR